GLVAEIAGHARCGFHRIVGDDPTDDQRAYVSLAQHIRQLSADKRTIRVFGDDHFARQAPHHLLELTALLAGAIAGFRLAREMTYVYDRPPGTSPGCKQMPDILFGLRVVATPPTRMINRLLNVDDYECCS